LAGPRDPISALITGLLRQLPSPPETR
jgi:hypothetical protein